MAIDVGVDGIFGARVRELRRERGITLRVLAAAVGIDFSYLSKIENGHQPPPSEATIERMAQTLGVGARDLLLSARKVPRSLKQALLDASPEAMEIVMLVATRELTDDQYRRMLDIAREDTVPDFHQAIGAIPLKDGMPTATEAIRQAREEGR